MYLCSKDSKISSIIMYNIYFGSRSITICERNANIMNNPNAIVLHISEDFDFNKIIDILDNSPKINNILIFADDANSEAVFRNICSIFSELNAAGGIVENKNGEFLLIFRNNMWDLPKGKQESGEEIKKCALREIEEECGIKGMSIANEICITRHCYRANDKFLLKHTHWFNMKYKGDGPLKPQTEENIHNAIWVKKDDLPKYLNSTFPSILEVFRNAGLK